jgi:hypothetical protein
MKGNTLEKFSVVQTEEEGAPVVQQDWATPAQRGEDQWAVYRDRNMTVPDRTGASTWNGDWNNRRPYIGAAGLVQLQGDEKKAAAAAPLARPDVPVRGEKQWQDWAQAHVDALDHQTNTSQNRPPYKSTVQ